MKIFFTKNKKIALIVQKYLRKRISVSHFYLSTMREMIETVGQQPRDILYVIRFRR